MKSTPILPSILFFGDSDIYISILILLTLREDGKRAEVEFSLLPLHPGCTQSTEILQKNVNVFIYRSVHYKKCNSAIVIDNRHNINHLILWIKTKNSFASFNITYMYEGNARIDMMTQWYTLRWNVLFRLVEYWSSYEILVRYKLG